MDVVVNGVGIAYTVAGEPYAPSMVLLHGGGQDRTTWDPVLPDLSRDHRVHALDLRGFGESGRPGQYSFELMCDDVVAFLDELGLDGVVLVGHSMGGTVSWLVAEERSDRLSRLVIEDVAPPRVGDPPVSIPPRPETPLPFDYDALASVIRHLSNPDPTWWERLGRISAPTLIVAGGPSSHVDQARLEEITAIVPDCRLTAIAAGHHIHRDAPTEFLAAIRDFLPD